MVRFFLMHKDIPCGTLTYDETTGRIVNYNDFKTGESPFLGNSNDAKLKKWWEFRSIPASRAAVNDMLKEAGCFNPGTYLGKNLALSMTDAYWIRPEDMDVSYNEIKFSNFAAYHDGKVPYHNATSYDPNASLGGQMDKYWDLSNNPPVLVKESSKYFGQQSINEVFATRLHEMQKTSVPFVRYSATMTEDRTVLCRCNAFTADSIELIPAYEIIESQKIRNDTSLYDGYIEICIQNGIPREIMQSFMDYQTMTDFIISNTDEHLLNFGVLRDPNTMKLLGPAPIFDSGNSMFFRDDRRYPYTRAGLLEKKITSFYNKEEAMLKKVKNRSIVKTDLLPEPREVKRLYAESGIPEWKADVISKNYETKIQMVKEFQHGKTISLYTEKQKEKVLLREQKNEEKASVKFVMLCGIPGSGKTAEANRLMQSFVDEGFHTVNPEKLYSVDKALSACSAGLLVNEQLIASGITPQVGDEGGITVINPGDIRKNLAERLGYYDNNFVFAIVDAQIKTALLSGVSVIYDASNLDRKTREHFIGIAKEAGIKSTDLHIMKANPEKSSTGLPSHRLQAMAERLQESEPGYGEGWTRIIIHEPEKEIGNTDHQFNDHEEL